MVSNIEMILKLMEPDLNEYQLAKLKNVLEIILKTTRNSLPNEELIDRFIQNKKLVGLSHSSIIHYTAEARKLGNYYPNRNFTELTTADIKDYLAEYVNERHLQASTTQTIIRFLSAFYDFLVNEEFMERNPCHRIEKVMVEKKVRKAFTDDDIAALRAVCNTNRYRAFLEFLYSTGCRISEVLSLSVKDIDFIEGEVVVFGKGHKERIVYLSNTCIQWLQTYLKERNAQPEEPLFGHLDKPKKRLTSRGAQLILKDLGLKSGVDNVHPHRFRRTMATHAMDKGMPIEQIKEILGHAKLDTTMIYCNVSAGKVKASFKDIFNE
jgi:site-specific recombinase XerD